MDVAKTRILVLDGGLEGDAAFELGGVDDLPSSTDVVQFLAVRAPVMFEHVPQADAPMSGARLKSSPGVESHR